MTSWLVSKHAAGLPTGRRARRAALVGALSLAAFMLLSFLVLPMVLRRAAEQEIGKRLGRRAAIGSIWLNPFTLSLTVERLDIFERDGSTPFFSLARLHVNVELASIYRRAPVVKEVLLAGPRLRLVRLAATGDGFADLAAYNFSDIVARWRSEGSTEAAKPGPPPTPSTAAPPRFSINNIRLVDGYVSFDDLPTGEHHVVSGLTIGIPFVSTLPIDLDTFVKPGLEVKIDGAPFSIEGRTKPFSDTLETTLELRLTGLDLARYASYIPLPLAVRLSSGVLDVALDLSFRRWPSIGAPRIDLAGHLELRNLELHESTGRRAAVRAPASKPILKLDNLTARVADADLAALRFHLAGLWLSGLEISAARLADGSIDWQHLLVGPGASRPPGKGTTPATPARFAIDSLLVNKVNLHLRDETVHPTFVENVRDLAIAVTHLSNAPGERATVTVSLHADPGGILTHTGTIVLEPLTLSGSVALLGLEPGRFAPYFGHRVGFDIARGEIRVGGGYRVTTHGGGTAMAVEGAFLSLDDVVLRPRGRGKPPDLLRLAHLGLSKVNLDVDARSVEVGEIQIRSFALHARRAESGVVDLTTLFGEETISDTDDSRGLRPGGGPASPHPNEGAPARPWSMRVARVDIDGGSLRFEDRAVKPTAVLTVDALSVKATTLSTDPAVRANLDLRLVLNKTGRIAVSGAVGSAPPTADLRLDLRQLAILPFQPYFNKNVSFLVTDGAVSVKGRAELGAASDERPRAGRAEAVSTVARGASPPPALPVKFEGDIDVSDLGVVDGRRSEKWVSWKALHVGGLHASSLPASLGVRQVKLEDFAARFTVFPDGHSNVEDLLVKDDGGKEEDKPARAQGSTRAARAGPGDRGGEGEPSEARGPRAPKRAGAASGAAAVPDVSVAEVLLHGGRFTFADRSIEPNFTSELTGFGGRISGLSAAASSTAEIALRGAVDRSGQLAIDGRINPLAKELFVDLRVSLKDFELPPLSPYAGRYVGYGVEKGKLTLDLAYQIADRRLHAENKLTLDQLTLGKAVPSAMAVHLPLKLALALLKDRHGVIDVDLPVTGSLDDPQFKLGKVILRALGTLVVKAVTAPFSLIAKAFGGGDEESFLEFGDGAADVSPRGLAKLRGVGQALRERAELSFEIEGLADPQRDEAALRQQTFDRRLRAQKQKALVESGSAAPQADTLRIEPAERPQLVQALYSSRERPRDSAAPKAKTSAADGDVLGDAASTGEMEKRLLASIPVTPDDLRQLALRRALAVKELLAKTAPEAIPRLFLVAPRTATPGNRVELKLKHD